MRALLRSHLRFFLFAALCGVVLRLFFIFRFPSVTSDSFIYGDIAKNWLQHGVYGISDSGAIIPTYIRLPGYPALLAAVFAIFGMEHYRAVLFIQLLVDIASCLLITDMTRRLLSDRGAKTAFLLAALCPFLANYVAAALTETLEIFFTVLALDLAVIGMEKLQARNLQPWIGCGLATGCAILLRPDGGLLLVAISGYLLIVILRSFLRRTGSSVHLFRAGLAVLILALIPLVPWTLRNLHTLQQFQPLAPRYANAQNEFVPLGFNRWVKTWIVDYASVEEIYWAVPGSSMDVDKLPSRAFDSDAQHDETGQLLDDYNNTLHVTPELDARFTALAVTRIHSAPLRYYCRLPLARIADMWLRPRTELLPSDSRWWEFDDDPKWSALAVAMGVINLLYIGAALSGLIRVRYAPPIALLLLFVLVRSAFLGSLENPETRYTLECYPIVILLAAALFQKTKSLR